MKRAGTNSINQLNLRAKFARVDRLAGLGHYGVLLLGLDDVKAVTDMANPVRSGKRQLKYVKPLSEASATIQEWDNNPNSERYGFPKIYQLTLELSDSSTITVNVHHSRIVHIPGQLLEDEVNGLPRLEAVFNRLLDLEKIVGGSAEMFWRGARPGFQGIVSEGYNMTDEDIDELQKQLDEYEHGLRRFLINRGVSLDALAQQVSDPRNHVDVQLQMISAITGIPRRILTGSERGELASTEDRNTWLSMIQERREEYAEPVILRPFIDKCIEFGVLAKPQTDYTIQWTDLWAASEKELVDIGQIRASALKDYLMVLGQWMLIPQIYSMRSFWAWQDQIDLIKEIQLKGIDEDIRGSATEEEEDLLMSLQTLSEAEKRTLITRYDPTRTTTLRNMFARNMRGRFDRLCAKINKAVVEQDCFGLLSTYQAIPPKRAFDFPRSQDKIAEFLDWLQEQIDNDILEVIPYAQLGQAIEQAWTNKFIQSAFQKGIYMARQELKKAGYAMPDFLPDIDVIFNAPFYLERVGLVYTRTYTDLKGIKTLWQVK